MRVLAIADGLFPAGGLERHLLANCRGLSQRGHTIDVAFLDDGDLRREWSSFAHELIQVSGFLPRKRQPVSSSLAFTRDVRNLRRLRPDVIYVFRPGLIHYGIAIGRPVTLQLCLPPRDNPAKSGRPWIDRNLKRISVAIAVSRDVQQRWQEARVLPRIELIEGSIDCEHFRPGSPEERASARRQLGIVEGAFVLLYAGRIVPEKGVHNLVSALSFVVEAAPETCLVIAGLGPDERYTQRLREMCLNQPVIILPLTVDVRPILYAADLAVLPSVWPDPRPRAVMEALASGLPIVTCAVGGIPDMMSGWLEDYLVAPNSVTNLAERIIAARSWRQTDPSIPARCRRTAVERFGQSREIDELERVLAEIAR